MKLSPIKAESFRFYWHLATDRSTLLRIHILLHSQEGSNNRILKSLALFARYNPQPLLRIDEESKILGANPASNQLLSATSLVGSQLKQLIPDIAQLDLKSMIEHEEVKEQVVSYGDQFFNFVFKGVAVLDSVHVYGKGIKLLKFTRSKAYARKAS